MRAITFQHQSWVLIILALALSVRAVIPAGYMVASPSLKLTVQICADGASGQTSVDIEVPLTKNKQKDNGGQQQESAPCAFSALSMASMTQDHSPLLIIMLAIILAAVVTSGAPFLRHQTLYLRPPLRGPPSLA
jgi:hypothetical protein